MPPVTLTADEQALVDAYRALVTKKAARDTANQAATAHELTARQAQVDVEVAADVVRRLALP